MKNHICTIFIILFCFAAFIKAQNKSTIQGTWISENNDFIKIKEEGSRFNILSTNEIEEQLNIMIKKDSLSFYTKYTKVGSDKIYFSKYDFYIKKMNEKQLILIPTSELSKNLFNNRPQIIFTRQEFNIDHSISFEKLIYRTTSCYGNCSIINLELDKNKNIYIHREIFNDKINSGNFKGTLSEEEYARFINILQTSNLRKWYFPEKDGSDSPITTLIIYHNGKRKYFKSMFPPAISNQLIKLLYEIGEKAQLIRTDKEKQMEY
ncbi:hypothetical protein SAMN05421846_106239 [Chryseobacterium taeanense]|uniref:DUF6438 domain-containing protein n=1 Tax=Chryseobacterium taeanense TaxID=311334 RepID=A0A1G8JWD9_9FLAO|nr:DUF6438 domain-containing protein [Chryseobacterium taeanense]SDI35468.1 hypothetical protein SAMN05421846_106239 [Chryseobacterium taeanense]